MRFAILCDEDVHGANWKLVSVASRFRTIFLFPIVDEGFGFVAIRHFEVRVFVSRSSAPFAARPSSAVTFMCAAVTVIFQKRASGSNLSPAYTKMHF